MPHELYGIITFKWNYQCHATFAALSCSAYFFSFKRIYANPQFIQFHLHTFSQHIIIYLLLITIVISSIRYVTHVALKRHQVT